MEIINDTEVFQPNECFFACGIDDPDGDKIVTVYITSKNFWDEEGFLDDCFGDHSLKEGALPSGIDSIMEATWESSFSIKETRKLMEDKGFVFSQDMYNSLWGD